MAANLNLLASLRPTKVHADFAGRRWPLEAATASDWLSAIAHDFEELEGVFPGLIAPEDLEDFWPICLQQWPGGMVRVAARQAVGTAAGRDWWWTVNLTRMALGGWIYINGILVRQGVLCDRLGLADWLDACYSLLWERSAEEQRKSLDLALSTPPRGVKGGKEAIRKMMADFAAD